MRAIGRKVFSEVLPNVGVDFVIDIMALLVVHDPASLFHLVSSCPPSCS